MNQSQEMCMRAGSQLGRDASPDLFLVFVGVMPQADSG
jgi:hypothetical protein